MILLSAYRETYESAIEQLPEKQCEVFQLRVNEGLTNQEVADYLIISVYNDWRRTGYPELAIIKDPVINGIPLRFVVPNSELDNNSENLEATGIPLGQDAMMVPVWWDS